MDEQYVRLDTGRVGLFQLIFGFTIGGNMLSRLFVGLCCRMGWCVVGLGMKFSWLYQIVVYVKS